MLQEGLQNPIGLTLLNTIYSVIKKGPDNYSNSYRFKSIFFLHFKYDCDYRIVSLVVKFWFSVTFVFCTKMNRDEAHINIKVSKLF